MLEFKGEGGTLNEAYSRARAARDAYEATEHATPDPERPPVRYVVRRPFSSNHFYEVVMERHDTSPSDRRQGREEWIPVQ